MRLDYRYVGIRGKTMSLLYHIMAVVDKTAEVTYIDITYPETGIRCLYK